MKEETYYITTPDQQHLFVYTWLPGNQNIKAIVHLIHGKAEHAGRYKNFAEFLTSHGYGIVAFDLRGHGKTAKTFENTGFIATKNGWKIVLEDIFFINQHIREKFPGKKIILMGHSMGSFYSRGYLDIHPETISGIILSGTAWQPVWLLNFGLFVASLQIFFKGPKHRSRLLEKLSTGKLNKKFKPNHTPFDWLSRDVESCQKYTDDDFCGYDCSAALFRDLFHIIKYIQKPQLYKNSQNYIPVFIFSGTDDGVGLFGKGPEKLKKFLLLKNFNDVTLHLYNKGRHEMLNEINKEQVYNDILHWLESKIEHD